jgi:hypothetical protein
MIMLTNLRHIPAAVGFGIVVTTLSLTAHAAPTAQALDQQEQRVIGDLARGDDAIAAGHQKAALVAIERAQTTLLNAEQAGTYQAPQAMQALDDAHADIVRDKLPAAAGLLHSAEGDLATPKVG